MNAILGLLAIGFLLVGMYGLIKYKESKKKQQPIANPSKKE